MIDNEGLIQGPVANGESTDDTKPTLEGKGEPGDTIVVKDNDTPIGETTVDEDGNWSFTPDKELGEGEHKFTVVERNPAGNESKPSDPWTVIVDTTAPDKPSIGEVIDDVGLIQGPVANGGSTDDTKPTLEGKGVPGDTIIVKDYDTPIGETTVDRDGNWSFTPREPLGEGKHEFTVVERDPAGNESKPSDPWTVYMPPPLDLLAPEVPEMADGKIDAKEASDGTLVRIPVYEGMAVGDVVMLGWPELSLTQVVKAEDLSTGVEFTIPAEYLVNQDVTISLYYGVVDATGRVYASPYTEVILSTKVPAPTLGEVIDDEGPITGPVGNGESTDDTTPTLKGKGEPGDTIVVIDNGTPIGETTVDRDGNWSFTPGEQLGEGEHKFTVVERNPAGNESRPSDPWTIIVDTTAPDAQATITYMGKDHNLAYRNVAPNNYFSTNDGSAGRLIMGSLTAELADGEKVQVSVDGGKTWRDALIDDKGSWVFQDNTSHEASWTIQTRVVDEAGNWGDEVSQQVTLDTIAPDAPVSARVIYNPTIDNLMVRVEYPSSVAVGDLVLIAIGDMGSFAHKVTEADQMQGFTNIVLTIEGSEALQSGATFGGVALFDLAGNLSAYSGGNAETEQFHVVESGRIKTGGVGYNVYIGSDGDNVFTVDDVNISNMTLFGNGGLDTLKLTGAEQTLDLSKTVVRLMSIEVFDITGTGDNTLKLSLGDVLDLGGKDLFIADGRTQVMVKGDAGDKVDLSDLLPDGGDVGDWAQQSGTTTVGGVEYDVFYHSGLNADLLVQHGVETVLNNH